MDDAKPAYIAESSATDYRKEKPQTFRRIIEPIHWQSNNKRQPRSGYQDLAVAGVEQYNPSLKWIPLENGEPQAKRANEFNIPESPITVATYSCNDSNVECVPSQSICYTKAEMSKPKRARDMLAQEHCLSVFSERSEQQ